MIEIVAKKNEKNFLGRVGENQARAVLFDVSEFLREFPGASIALLNKRPKDTLAYPVPVGNYSVEGNTLRWVLQSGDLAYGGVGRCEIVASKNSAIVKSEIYLTFTDEALDGSADPPDPWQSWVQDVEDAAEHAAASAELLENCNAVAETLTPGSDATATYEDGTFSFGIPRGADGTDGQDGVTPNVTVGSTTTGEAGTDASVTRRAGSPDSAPVFDFTIPRGDKGDKGEPGLESVLKGTQISGNQYRLGIERV